MYLMLSWQAGERPYLDMLPVADIVATLKLLRQAASAGRDIELYRAEGDALIKIYPDAEVATVIDAHLIAKDRLE